MSGIFVVRDGKLDELQRKQFTKEADFQKFLAEYPALLAGNEINPSSPRKWLLITQEKSIPAQIEGEPWWSVDHLFLDQDGVPTFVEVKRSSDTRARRLVVAQMLDYAANAVAYWPADEIRETFSEKYGSDHESVLRKFIGEDADTNVFWKSVKSNLQEGHIRLLFVADVIHPELRRIVEFLNEQMDPAEVLALELRQYEGDGIKTITPVLYGQTSRAQQRKNGGVPIRIWSEEEIYGEIEARFNASEGQLARKIVARMKDAGAEIVVGQGVKDTSIRGRFSYAGKHFSPFAVWTSGVLEVGLKPVMETFTEGATKREHLRGLLNQIGGVNVPDSKGYPNIRLGLMIQEHELNKLLDAIAWVRDEVKKAG